MLSLDHFAVSAETLDAGTTYVEEALGVRLQDGGNHPLMGTHNRLLGLANGLYLEVIAIDPDAPKPDRARWFGLNSFEGRPRLTNWIARTDDLTAAVAASPDGTGVPIALTRGDLRWQMAVPEDGKLPFDGFYPALIEWEGAAHPAERLTQSGCTLKRFEVAHPNANALKDALNPLLQDDRLRIVEGEPSIWAEFDTPNGPRSLR
ncbi:VOC family protein [Aliiroseovarius sp. YM-037]|uniref:VOC family protein n=1 Tax=Aliiroseovarius sp. YM-037 TaxID=3341728 RepID=UPI003A813B7F